MTKNLHPIDRAARGLIGVAIMVFLFLNHGNGYLQEPVLIVLLGIFGVLNLISLATSWCPVYHFAGINTRKNK